LTASSQRLPSTAIRAASVVEIGPRPGHLVGAVAGEQYLEQLQLAGPERHERAREVEAPGADELINGVGVGFSSSAKLALRKSYTDPIRASLTGDSRRDSINRTASAKVRKSIFVTD